MWTARWNKVRPSSGRDTRDLCSVQNSIHFRFEITITAVAVRWVDVSVFGWVVRGGLGGGGRANRPPRRLPCTIDVPTDSNLRLFAFCKRTPPPYPLTIYIMVVPRRRRGIYLLQQQLRPTRRNWFGLTRHFYRPIIDEMRIIINVFNSRSYMNYKCKIDNNELQQRSWTRNDVWNRRTKYVVDHFTQRVLTHFWSHRTNSNLLFIYINS